MGLLDSLIYGYRYLVDGSGTQASQRSKLKFVGATITDDSANQQTVVTISGGGGGLSVAGATGAAQLNSGSSTLAATTTNSFLEGSTTVGLKVNGNYIAQATSNTMVWSLNESDNMYNANFATRSGVVQNAYVSTNTTQTLYSWTIVDNAVTVATGELVWTLADGSKTGEEIRRLRMKSVSGTVTPATVRVIENADTDDTNVTYTINNSGSTIRHQFTPNYGGTCRVALVHTRYERLIGS